MISQHASASRQEHPATKTWQLTDYSSVDLAFFGKKNIFPIKVYTLFFYNIVLSYIIHVIFLYFGKQQKLMWLLCVIFMLMVMWNQI